MADQEQLRRRMAMEEEEAAGEPGHPGVDQYQKPPMTAGGAALGTGTDPGTNWDAAKSWADKAALGAGPQIAGVIGAIANAAVNPGTSDLDAYRAVRDASKHDIDYSESTGAGKAVGPIAALSTPIPIKGLGPGASVGDKATRAALVGAGLGAVSGAVNSPVDLTNMETGDLKRLAINSLLGAGEGALGGLATGAGMSTVGAPARSASRRLPMDMLGVTEPARRSMQRQGIYDAAGDDLLALVRPGRSGMRKGSLTQDALAELKKRGVDLGASIDAIDAKSGGQSVPTASMATSVLREAAPYSKGSLQSKQVAGRMGDEAENLLESLGESPIPLSKAEEFKSKEFGPGVAKLLRHAGEPAAKTTALGETYRALKGANEAAAQRVDPALAGKFIDAKKAYSRLAAPLEGANVERGPLKGSDLDWGEALNQPETPLMEKLAAAGIPKWMSGAVVTPANIAGRAYGRGLAANAAEFAANRMSKNTGGGVGLAGGQAVGDALAPWAKFLKRDEEER